MKKYVNGQYIEMTVNEIAEIKQTQSELFYTKLNEPLTSQQKLELFIESIPVLPQPKIINRPGRVWKPMYDIENHCFGWEEIPDPYYTPTQNGSYIDPIMYIEGMAVTVNLWYKFDDENIWECIKTGENSSYSSEWFDILYMGG